MASTSFLINVAFLFHWSLNAINFCWSSTLKCLFWGSQFSMIIFGLFAEETVRFFGAWTCKQYVKLNGIVICFIIYMISFLINYTDNPMQQLGSYEIILEAYL